MKIILKSAPDEKDRQKFEPEHQAIEPIEFSISEDQRKTSEELLRHARSEMKSKKRHSYSK